MNEDNHQFTLSLLKSFNVDEWRDFFNGYNIIKQVGGLNYYIDLYIDTICGVTISITCYNHGVEMITLANNIWSQELRDYIDNVRGMINL